MMRVCCRASSRLCRAVGLPRPIAAALAGGAKEQCTRSATPPAASQLNAAPPGRWQPAAGGSGAARRPAASPFRHPGRHLVHGSACWQARAFTQDDIAADVGVMVEGEPSGFRCDGAFLACYPVLLAAVAACRSVPAACFEARGLTFPHAHLSIQPCSEAELEALAEQLYEDGLAAAKEAALYVLNVEEGGEREEPPGA